MKGKSCQMRKKEKALKMCSVLEEIYPDEQCSLVYSKPYELMIAARLSAQCTDARVNIVTEKLFRKYPTLESFANADYETLCEDVRPCGFFKTKAQSIIGMAQKLISDFDGIIPQTIDELTTLPGIGRKTANLLLGDVYGKPAIVCDTHCIRITGRIGLTNETQPQKVENDLRNLIPEDISSDTCHRLVQFGRDVCKARLPLCNNCPMTSICNYFTSNKKGNKHENN
jgi:endonuclease-3